MLLLHFVSNNVLPSIFRGYPVVYPLGNEQKWLFEKTKQAYSMSENKRNVVYKYELINVLCKKYNGGAKWQPIVFPKYDG